MDKSSIKIMACPKCLGDLDLENQHSEGNNITDGTLFCPRCQLQYSITDGVAIFGLNPMHLEDVSKEMHGENEWMIETNDIGVHLEFAEHSSLTVEGLLKKVIGRLNKNSRVLDLGAGLGCLQSWQLSRYGMTSFAVDVCPEFMMASGTVARDGKIERIVSDCSVLPFKDNSFDLIFCKEIIHHVDNLSDLMDEIWRVTSDNGHIIVIEPSISILQSRKKLARNDVAKNVGLNHQFYSYLDYVNYIRKISDIKDIDGEITVIDPKNHPLLHLIQKPIIKLTELFPYKNILLRAHLIFIYGSIFIVSVKKKKYDRRSNTRDVIPINIKEINLDQVEYYRNVLVPGLYEVFIKNYS